MKKIKSVEYSDIDLESDRVKATVTFIDGDVQTFTDPADLKRIQEQITKQLSEV